MPYLQGLGSSTCVHAEKLHLDNKYNILAKHYAEIHKTLVENIQY